MKHLKRPHQGFAAIAAVFLLVVLAALGAFMLTFSNTQQLTSAQDVQGSRAYWAARAGLAWGVGSVAVSSAACPVPPAPFTVDGFKLTVTCVRSTYSENGNTVVVFTFSSTAQLGVTPPSPGSAGYIERSVSVSVEL
jgi:MSHA biogenesis protein MshP